MQAQPTISVFLPCYNAHAYLPRALDSLRAQTFRDFEIIIINDGSTDPETNAYLESLPDDVRVVHQENRGLSGARNRGFNEARADLILPLDCDDWLAPKFLTDAHAALQAAPEKSFVFADLTLEGEAAGVLEKPHNSFEQLYFNQLPYCILLPRAAWEAIGGYDESMQLGYEDWEFNIRLGLNGYTGLPLNKPHFHYHVSADGMLASTSRVRHVELWRYIRDKHAEAYGAKELWRRWQICSPMESARPLIFYVIWELLFRLLPDKVLTALFQISQPMSHSAREARRLRRAITTRDRGGRQGFFAPILQRIAVPAAMVPALVSRLATYLTIVVAARIMIPEEFGAFTVLTVLGGVVNAVVSGGGDMWLNRFVTQEKVSRNRPPPVWPFYLTISFVVAIGTMLMAWGVTALVPALHEQSGAILLTVFTFGLAGISEALLATLRSTGRTILFFSVRDILVPITALIFLIILRPESVSGFFLILAGVWAAVLVTFSLYALLVAQWKCQMGWLHRSLATPLIKHTLLLMMTNIMSRASNYIDILVLLFFVGLADLGEYRIAAQFAIGFIVVQHFVFLSLPYQLRYVGSSAERQYSRRILQDIQRNLLTLSLIALVFVLVLSEWLLSILGERFIESAHVVRAMFLIRFLELLWGPQHEVLISNGLVRFEVAASLSGITAWIITFAFIYKLVDPVTAAIIATAIGVHLGHIIRATTLTSRGIYCPRLVPLRQQT